MGTATRPVLLYDGHCALCNSVVRMVLRGDRHGRFRFAPLHGEYAAALFEHHPRLTGIDSLVLVEQAAGDASAGPAGGGSRISVRSDAALRCARLLGGPWRALLVLSVIPRRLRDWAYDRVAGVRYRLFGRYEECPVPPAEVRERFLD